MTATFLPSMVILPYAHPIRNKIFVAPNKKLPSWEPFNLSYYIYTPVEWSIKKVLTTLFYI